MLIVIIVYWLELRCTQTPREHLDGEKWSGYEVLDALRLSAGRIL